MVAGTLLASASFSLFAGLLYAYVGRVVGQRQVSKEAALAATMFQVWWYGLGAFSLLGALVSLLAAGGLLGLTAMVTYTHVVLLAICVFLLALLYYLLYLYTGRRGLIWPLSAFYVVYFGYLVYVIQLADPVGVAVGRWNVQLEYADEAVLQRGLGGALLFLLVGPQILGALAYFLLYFQVTERAQKYRIAMVSWSIVVWFGSSLVAGLAGLSDLDWWQVVSRLIGMTAALAILMAYRPPAWIARRLAAPPAPAQGAPA